MKKVVEEKQVDKDVGKVRVDAEVKVEVNKSIMLEVAVMEKEKEKKMMKEMQKKEEWLLGPCCFITMPGSMFTHMILVPENAAEHLFDLALVDEVQASDNMGKRFDWKPGVAPEVQKHAICKALPAGAQKESLLRKFFVDNGCEDETERKLKVEKEICVLTC